MSRLSEGLARLEKKAADDDQDARNKVRRGGRGREGGREQTDEAGAAGGLTDSCPWTAGWLVCDYRSIDVSSMLCSSLAVGGAEPRPGRAPGSTAGGRREGESVRRGGGGRQAAPREWDDWRADLYACTMLCCITVGGCVWQLLTLSSHMESAMSTTRSSLGDRVRAIEDTVSQSVSQSVRTQAAI